MAFSWGDWAKSKADIALALNEGGCGGGYSEAVLVLCATLNTMAAEVFGKGGKGKPRDDKFKFVELITNYSTISLSPGTISLPFLVGWLAEEKRFKEANLIMDRFNFAYDTRILIGSETDLIETRIQEECRSLSLSDIRNASYARILYEDVRSNLVHQYSIGLRASHLPMTRRNTEVSYNNRSDRYAPPDSYRHIICFHLPWLVEL